MKSKLLICPTCKTQSIEEVSAGSTQYLPVLSAVEFPAGWSVDEYVDNPRYEIEDGHVQYYQCRHCEIRGGIGRFIQA